MRKLVLALLLIAAPVAAHAMTVSEFLAKVEGLKKKGPMALFSKDIGVLKKEVVTAGKQLRAEQNAAAKAGRKPVACMPVKASVGNKELLGHFEAIPPAQRGMSVKSAFTGLMRKKYPCP